MSEHGSRSRYTTGCRCARCRGANARYKQAHRTMLRGLGTACPRLIPHGRSGYSDWGCRCKTCRAAVSGATWGPSAQPPASTTTKES